jgi:hypothetical protein
MSAQDRHSPDARICRNCRYVWLRPGADAKLTQVCDKFQISFAAAKLLAFRDSASMTRPEPWELAMHGHLAQSPGARS